jgi:two-component system NtrC family sensor kinase
LSGLKQELLFPVIGIILVFGLLTTLIGTHFIQSMTLKEAQARVTNNLHGAWAVLDAELDRIQQTVSFIGKKETLILALRDNDPGRIRARLRTLKDDSHFDFLTVTNSGGTTVCRTTYRGTVGDDVVADDFVRDALAGKPGKGFHVFPPERLELEGDHLRQRAYLPLKDTPRAKPAGRQVEQRGMVMAASSPVADENGKILGCVYGGILLNGNNGLVDRIRSVVFGDETYEGRMVGTVTVFQRDTRIATNVLDRNGSRAVGTRVSEEVYDRTLEKGLPWYGRAFVVSDWTISAYEPIKDTNGEIVGALYVGAREKKYDDMKVRLIVAFVALSLLWVAILLLVSIQVSRAFVTPILNLAGAAREVSSGSTSVNIPPVKSRDEIGDLNEAFRHMVQAIREREEALLAANRELTRSNLNYVEMLSFVSHELKNQISGSAIALRTLQRNTSGTLSGEDARLLSSLGDTMGNIAAMLRNYLDLSRLEIGELKVSKRRINFLTEIVVPTLDSLSMLIDRRNILIRNRNHARAELSSDPAILGTIYYNLLHNAVKFSREGGAIRLSSEERGSRFDFEVWNEGEGISPEMQGKVFDKFFRTEKRVKDFPQGSGLGLFITRTLVEMLGGTIRAESEPGAWAAFYVTLPKE